MRHVILSCVFVLLLAFAPVQTSAETNADATLFKGFNAGALTRADKRFLQAALAFEGHYNGLLDGDWGPRSRRALSQYSRREFGTSAETWHMATLAFGLFERVRDDGWEIRHFDGLNMSFLFPATNAEVDPATETFVNWRHRSSSLAFSVGIHDRKTAQHLHNFTSDWHESGRDPYSMRRTNQAITTARKRSGALLYTRSNFINGSWSTIMLSADGRDGTLLNTVASSISVGYGAPLSVTKGGELDSAIRQVIALMEEAEKPKAGSNSVVSAPATPPKDTAESGTELGSGTGVYVSADGHVLTNAHVIAGCGTLFVDGVKARVIETSNIFDLALLQTVTAHDKSVAIFSASPAQLNSDVTVAGFPYAGLLSGLNVTRGAVSGLRGIGGEVTQIQITAPVQPGNSGGPVLGANGAVVGIVVSKLDAIKIADAMGDIPQNVNFAIRGEIAKLFLSQNGVQPLTLDKGEIIAPVELADRASGFTAFIECR